MAMPRQKAIKVFADSLLCAPHPAPVRPSVSITPPPPPPKFAVCAMRGVSGWLRRRDATSSDRPRGVRAGARLFRALPAAAVLALPLLFGPAAEAQTTRLLVGNQGAGTSSPLAVISNYYPAQAFTTGANSAGYNVANVEIEFTSAPSAAALGDMTLTIRNADGSDPGTVVGTLTNPGSGAAGFNTFNAPGGGIDLAASTTYFVDIRGLSGSNTLSLTAAAGTGNGNEQSGSLSDWSIADAFRLFSAGSWADRTGATLRMKISGTVKMAPAAPTGLMARAGDARVTLTWDDPDNDSITGYEYQQRTSGGSWGGWTDFTSDADTTTLTVTGLTNGTAYEFQLRAVNASGASAASETVSATPAVPAAPAAPTGFTIDTGDTEITLKWTDPGNDAITKYQYRQGTGPLGSITWADWTDIPASDEDTTEHKVTGLTNGTRYYFEVRAVAGTVNGTATASTAITPVAKPAAPTGLSATGGATEVTLSWTNPNNATITGYEYRQRTSGSSTWGEWTAIASSGATTTSHTVTGLTNYTRYDFQLRAVGLSGNGARSTTESAIPRPAGAPDAPGLTITDGDTQVTLAWSDPSNNAITKYQYRRGTGPSNSINWGNWTDIPMSGAATTGYTVTGLTNGTRYWFEVRAVAGTVFGVASSIFGDPNPKPAQPTGLSAAPGDGQVVLTWSDPSDSSIFSYGYELRTGNTWGGLTLFTSDDTTTTYTVTGLTNGTEYGFRLYASNTIGISPASAVVTATPLDAGALDAPTGLTATAGDASGEVDLSWTAPSGTITKYQVRRGSGDPLVWGAWTDIPNSASLTSHTVTGLTDGTQYSFQIRAVSGTGGSTVLGAMSGAMTATPVAPTPEVSVAIVRGESLTVDSGGALLLPEDVAVGTIPVQFRVSASPAPATDLTVCVNIAETGVDRVAASAEGAKTVTITGGSATVDYPAISWTDDAVDNRDSLVTMTVVAPSDSSCSQTGYTVSSSASSGSFRILDNERTSLGLSSTDTTMTEGAASQTAVAAVTLGRRLYAGEILAYGVGLSTTTGARLPDGDGATPQDFTVSVSGTGVAATGLDTASPVVTFTGDDDNTVQVATLTFTPTAGTDADGADETVRVGFGSPGSATNVGGGAAGTGSVDLTIDDSVGLTVSSTTLTVEEEGSNTYTVVLDSQPSATVTVTVGGASGEVTVDTDTATPGNQNTLTFTTGTWSTAQTVTVSAGDDGDTANDSATLTHTAAGGDYASVTGDNVAVTVTDNDRPGLVLDPTALTVAEGGSGTYTVALATQPTGSVTVTVAGASGEVTVDTDSGTDGDQSTLTFTTTTWSTAQTVTVSVDEDDDTTNDSATLTHSASGGGYGSVTGSVAVTVTDDDTAPAAPAGFTAAAGDQQVVLSWTDPNNSAIDSWQFRQRTPPDTGAWGSWTAIASSTATTTTHTVTGLTNGTAYGFQVRAADGALEGAASSEATATPTAATPGVATTQPSDRQVTEGDAADTAAFTVALNTRPSDNVAVTVTAPAGLELAGPGSSTFGGRAELAFIASTWNSAQTVTVRATDDNTDSPLGRELSVAYSTSSRDSSYNTLSGAAATVTVADNDPTAVALAGAAGDVAEGGTKTFTVTLGRGLVNGEALAVPLTFGGAATRGADYTTACPAAPPAGVACANLDSGNAMVTFTGPSAGTTARTVTLTLTAAADGAAEPGGETVAIGLGTLDASSGAGLGGGASGADNLADFRITDPDTSVPTVAITGVPARISGVSDITATFTFSEDVTGFATDDVTVTGGTKGTFTATSATAYTLAITPTSGSNVVVTVAANAATDGTNTGPATAESATAVWTALVFSSTTVTVVEEASATYTVALSSQPDGNVTVTVGGASGEVTFDTDSAAPGNQSTLTFTTATWSTAQTVTVSAGEDGDTANDSATLTHSASGGGYGSATGSVAVTVADNDAPAAAPPAKPEGFKAEAGNGQVTLSWTDPGNSGITGWEYWLHGRWTPIPGSGAGTVEYTVTGLSNRVAHTFRVRAAAGAVKGAASDRAAATPSAPPPRLSVSSLEVAEGGEATYTVRLGSRPPEGAGGAIVWIISDNPDVTADPESLDFTRANWDAPQTVTVKAARDDDDVADAATLEHRATGGRQEARPALLAVAVTGDAGAPPATPVDPTPATPSDPPVDPAPVDPPPDTTPEDPTPATPADPTPSTPSDPPPDTTPADPTPADPPANTPPIAAAAIPDQSAEAGAAFGYAVPDGAFSDADGDPLSYSASLAGGGPLPAWLSFDPASRSFSGAPGPSDAGVLAVRVAADDGRGGSASAVFEIVVAAPAAPPAVSVRAGPAVSEGGEALFTVTAEPPPSGPLAVSAEVSGSGGFAAAGELGPRAVALTPSRPSAVVAVATVDDRRDEPDGSVALALRPGPGYALGSPASASVAVADNDEPSLIVSESSLALEEGAGAAYTVALGTEPPGPVAVSVAVSEGAGVSTAPASLSFTADDWNAPRTVTVAALEDDDIADQSGSITHAASGGGYGGVSAEVAVMVADNDEPSLIVSPSSLSLEEGASATYTVALGAAPLGAVTVAVAVSEGAGVEISPASLAFTADNWNAPQTVAVSALEDDDIADHSGALVHTASGGGYGGVSAEVAVMVSDDDEPLLIVSESSLSIDEGAGATYTVALGAEPSGAVSVSIAVSEGAGVSASPASLAFTADDWSMAQTVTVSALEDDDAADQSGALVHAASGGGYGGVSAEVAVTVADDDGPSVAAAAWMPRFGRVAAEQIIEGVGDRVASLRGRAAMRSEDAANGGGGAGFEAVLAGRALGAYGSFPGGSPDGGLAGGERGMPAARPDAGGRRALPALGAGAYSGDAAYSGAVGPSAAFPQAAGARGERPSGGLLRAALADSSFSAGGRAAGGSSWGLWGRGSLASFEGRAAGGAAVDGDVATGQAGADWSSGRLLLGLSASYSRGEGVHAAPGGGRVPMESSMAALAPYAAVDAGRFSAWGAFGAGRGDMSLSPEGGAEAGADISMEMGAAGLRGDLADLGGGWRLSLAADAMAARFVSEEAPGLPEAEARASRFRAAVEASWTRALVGGGEFSARLEGGARRDGGDAERGWGAEVSAGLSWARGALAFGIEGRHLAAHEDGGFSRTGASARLDWDCGPDGLGPSASLRRRWGAAEAAGAERMLSERRMGRLGAEPDAGGLEAELGWGLALPGGRFLAAPFLLHGAQAGGSMQTLGWRMKPLGADGAAAGLGMALKLTRRTGAAANDERGILLEARLGF